MKWMATEGGPPGPQVAQRERVFLLGMAIALAATVVAGFGLWNLHGLSTFHAPWFTHVHALSFMGWMALYVLQNVLVVRGDVSRHRRLGRYGAAWAAWVAVVGMALAPWSLHLHRTPPFFTPAFFLALDEGNMLLFAALASAALANVGRPDWHRRLMLCATIILAAPAWGRLLVLVGVFGPWTNAAALAAYVVVAMAADLVIRGAIHRAYYWGLAAVAAWPVGVALATRFPPFVALADTIAR